MRRIRCDGISPNGGMANLLNDVLEHAINPGNGRGPAIWREEDRIGLREFLNGIAKTIPKPFLPPPRSGVPRDVFIRQKP